MRERRDSNPRCLPWQGRGAGRPRGLVLLALLSHFAAGPKLIACGQSHEISGGCFQTLEFENAYYHISCHGACAPVSRHSCRRCPRGLAWCADGENRTPNRGGSRLPPRDSCGFHHRKLRQLPPSFRRVRLSPWLWKGFDFWMVLLYLFICCCGAGRSRTALIPFAPRRTPVLSQAGTPWMLLT